MVIKEEKGGGGEGEVGFTGTARLRLFTLESRSLLLYVGFMANK